MRQLRTPSKHYIGNRLKMLRKPTEDSRNSVEIETKYKYKFKVFTIQQPVV